MKCVDLMLLSECWMGWLLEEGLVGFLPREYLRGQVRPDMQSAISFLTSPVIHLPLVILHVRLRGRWGECSWFLSLYVSFTSRRDCVQCRAAISYFCLVKYCRRNENMFCTRVFGFLCKAVLILSCHFVWVMEEYLVLLRLKTWE